MPPTDDTSRREPRSRDVRDASAGGRVGWMALVFAILLVAMSVYAALDWWLAGPGAGAARGR